MIKLLNNQKNLNIFLIIKLYRLNKIKFKVK